MLKRTGWGEERILWSIVFLSLNTKEQLLGRMMPSGNSTGRLILLILLVLFSGEHTALNVHFHLYCLPGSLRLHTCQPSRPLLTIDTGTRYDSVLAIISLKRQWPRWTAISRNVMEPNRTKPAKNTTISASSSLPCLTLPPSNALYSHYLFDDAAYFSSGSFTCICIMLFVPTLPWVCLSRPLLHPARKINHSLLMCFCLKYLESV